MNRFIKLGGVAAIAALAFTACDDDNPVETPTGETDAVYVSFESGSYWTYESETYDDPAGNNVVEKDSTVVTSVEQFEGKDAYVYTTWTESNGVYGSEPSSIEYYSESEGDIYLHAASINDRLATDEIKAILDFSIPDQWLLIRDADNAGQRTLQEVPIPDGPITFSGIEGQLKNGKLIISAENKGASEVTGSNGAAYQADHIELLFALTGDAKGQLGTFEIEGTVSGSTSYSLWMSDSLGILKTNFLPFVVNAMISGNETEVFKAAGTKNTILNSQTTVDSKVTTQ